MLELKNISSGYGKQNVLTNVSIAFEKGSLTSVIGTNGCGKSTLLKTALGLLPCSSGEVRLDGTALRAMSRTEIAKKISYLSQEKNLPDMTVRELVLHGRFPYLNYPRHYTSRDKELARAAMETMELEALSDLPLSQLSGGMRQRAYIAMALTQDTDCILLDEPTAHLDVARRLELMKLLRTLANSGKAVVTVTHDLLLAFSFSDSIALLDGGNLVLHDTPETVCRANILESIFGISLSQSPETGDYQYEFKK